MTPETFERKPGSVWTRAIYDLLPDVHDCYPNCDGETKSMRWRPPKEDEKPHTWFKHDCYVQWLHGYPVIPPADHDFSRGPEYPASLPVT
jgi:hypothetical protein